MSADTDVSRSAAKRLICFKMLRGMLSVTFRLSLTKISVTRKLVKLGG
jgi:hypothetical protein